MQDPTPDATPPFLFSVDLEDVRTMIPDGDRYTEGVPRAMARYLAFLDENGMRCTFFTVGNIARAYPELIRELASAGHELACHSSEHRPLPRHDRESFRDDLARNLDDLQRAGAGEVTGFRAPVMSMTPETEWAYEVLHELGFQYSSSVLPAASPLFGWPGFERRVQRRAPGIWELPVTLTGWPILDLPFACGVYFRVLPLFVARLLCRRQRASGEPLVMYCHPYDIDTEQERFMHPELDDSRFFNWLMYVGRSRVVPRLQALVAESGAIVPYRDYVGQLAASTESRRSGSSA